MISLIIGNKGSGKTKHLIEDVNAAVAASNGNVVCIEKGNKLRFDVSSSARLIDIEEFGISGYDAYYGFLSGICAGNYDVTHVLGDATLRIVGRDYDKVVDFLDVFQSIRIVLSRGCWKFTTVFFNAVDDSVSQHIGSFHKSSFSF